MIPSDKNNTQVFVPHYNTYAFSRSSRKVSRSRCHDSQSYLIKGDAQNPCVWLQIIVCSMYWVQRSRKRASATVFNIPYSCIDASYRDPRLHSAKVARHAYTRQCSSINTIVVCKVHNTKLGCIVTKRPIHKMFWQTTNAVLVVNS